MYLRGHTLMYMESSAAIVLSMKTPNVKSAAANVAAAIIVDKTIYA